MVRFNVWFLSLGLVFFFRLESFFITILELHSFELGFCTLLYSFIFLNESSVSYKYISCLYLHTTAFKSV